MNRHDAPVEDGFLAALDQSGGSTPKASTRRPTLKVRAAPHCRFDEQSICLKRDDVR